MFRTDIQPVGTLCVCMCAYIYIYIFNVDYYYMACLFLCGHFLKRTLLKPVFPFSLFLYFLQALS